ncbi:MAG TPA: 4Fe-4S dicluster domain-containing protein [Verrucomicrobiae bacterium]|nr:4Fe-4S dicluster domain-containing protein [Verrucomicrobiae bacterium]
MTRWAMVVDLRKCIGCETCTAVCNQVNHPTSAAWRRIVECFVPGGNETRRVFVPLSCMQCQHPPCLDVCPTGATYQRPDGIVGIHRERCVGCGYCVLACPYMARSIASPGGPAYVDVNKLGDGQGDGAADVLGVSEKCSFCHTLVEDGLRCGLKPGLDPEATPACVVSCAAVALHFGDLNHPASNVSRLLRENKTIQLHEDLGTDPSIFYVVE